MTIFEAYNLTKKKLESAGIEDYVFEAKQIIKHITKLSSAQILTDYYRQLTDYEQKSLEEIIKQREIRYPLQYIFGEWDFYGRKFFVGPGVLVPRADTEVLIDTAKDFLKDKEDKSALDLCAGSGAVGITIAKEIPKCQVDMLEKFDSAFKYAQKNILRNAAFNSRIHKGDIFNGDLSDKKYTLIISNPPYIPKEEMAETSPEVSFEPETALLADDNGMEYYKAIINNYTDSLNPGGMLCFEVGAGQSERVKDLVLNAGYESIKVYKDLGGIERAVSGIKKGED